VFAAPFGDLPSVHRSGQPDVSYRQIRDPPLASGQRFFTVARVDHVIAFIAQGFDDQFADERIILCDKNSHQGSSVPPHLISIQKRQSP
jgi:hypothetical protein